MKKTLAETLLNKGIMRPGTLLYGKTQSYGLGQDLQMVPVELMLENFDGENFTCRDRLGREYVMHVDNVQEVDGMEPTRLASVFNIKADGSDKIAGKKRRRKPKSAQINNAMEGETHGKDKRTESSNQA